MSNKHYVIGIDGGGTKTHALLSDMDGTILTEAKGFGSNPNIIGFDRSAKVIFNLIRECCGKIKQPVKSVQKVVAGIAGIGRPADRELLHDELLKLSDKNRIIKLESDARIALEAALPWRPGIVLISGTGSIAYYRTEKNQFFRTGGWGRILGDDGSGYAIAREALRAVMSQFDGQGKPTMLTNIALEFFQIDSPEYLVSAIRKAEGEIAPFTPKVFEAAGKQDEVAIQILESNSDDLLRLVEALLQKELPEKKLTISTLGGLLEKNNGFSELVKKKICRKFPYVYFQKPKFPSMYGALILALEESQP
ncbi:MAG: hypothetical protein HYZ34_10745 [Ignavibacteriae bacterium]|nr:hypothetical protein [Ignavibacteriota bacterium]